MSAVRFVDGWIILDHEGEKDRWDWSNYCGIALFSIPGKGYAHILLIWTCNHLLRHQRPEQSGFTPGKSTIDCILALQVTVERRREFSCGLPTAYIDLKKAFDSVHRKSLWEILRLRGISTRIIKLIATLYTGTETSCGATLVNINVINLDFADDVAILSESLESLIVDLDAFSNDAKPLDL
ncbi:uncharacterized protein [Penaeus vannamei]|uniref:uncharacterized protein n=1 Tax=Penaeus vannamei TaxID=6689 RepID=UPI00387F8EA7